MKGTKEKISRLPAPAWSVPGPGAKPAESQELIAGLADLDPLIHERTRLLILTTLSASVECAQFFSDLKDTLRLTDGNLMAHLRTLEHAGLVELIKKGAGRGSTTAVRLTEQGQHSFRAYLDRIEALLKTARGAAEGGR